MNQIVDFRDRGDVGPAQTNSASVPETRAKPRQRLAKVVKHELR
jgi:hypothetical protein